MLFRSAPAASGECCPETFRTGTRCTAFFGSGEMMARGKRCTTLCGPKRAERSARSRRRPSGWYRARASRRSSSVDRAWRALEAAWDEAVLGSVVGHGLEPRTHGLDQIVANGGWPAVPCRAWPIHPSHRQRIHVLRATLRTQKVVDDTSTFLHAVRLPGAR